MQCQRCRTCTVKTPPSAEVLAKFYNGFKFCINETNKKIFLEAKFNRWFNDLGISKNSSMLDIGGGGGYFSMSFEKFGYGKATYIDLDPQACKYAKTLGISNVVCADACSLQPSAQKFDFIYCRHVIEHLTDPTKLIKSAVNLLSDRGLFVLQFPNGLSFERLMDRNHYANRKNLLAKANPDFSAFKIFKTLHSDKTAFGLDPIRHLWAISPKGISEYLNSLHVKFSVETKSILDSIYSPYFHKEPFLRTLRRVCYSLPHGKAHLVCFIRKN